MKKQVVGVKDPLRDSSENFLFEVVFPKVPNCFPDSLSKAAWNIDSNSPRYSILKFLPNNAANFVMSSREL
jgi:hypothetical protein